MSDPAQTESTGGGGETASTGSPRPVITFAVADLRRGEIVECLDGASVCPQLEGLAAAAPELCADEARPSALMLGRHANLEPSGGFDSIVLVSPDHIYVIYRVADRSSSVLLGISSRAQSVGWVLKQLRSRAALLTPES